MNNNESEKLDRLLRPLFDRLFYHRLRKDARLEIIKPLFQSVAVAQNFNITNKGWDNLNELLIDDKKSVTDKVNAILDGPIFEHLTVDDVVDALKKAQLNLYSYIDVRWYNTEKQRIIETEKQRIIDDAFNDMIPPTFDIAQVKALLSMYPLPPPEQLQ